LQLTAHPSWGIAVADNGDIYFADVLHGGTGTIWKIDADGHVEKILTDFHAHYLQLDKVGNLWVAEDRWIEGVVEDEGEQTLLKISPDGKQETIIFTKDRDDFFGGAFAVGHDEAVYFALHKKIWKRPFTGKTSLEIDHEFERIVTLYFDKESSLWVADKGHKNGTLYKWNETDGLIEYATNLIPIDPATPIFPEERFHLFFGITRDEDGLMYISESAGRSIQQIDENGIATIFYVSEEKWYPAGMDFYKGDAIIMEIGYDKRHLGPRIVRVDTDGKRAVLFDYQKYKKRR
jgi:hypothetical protein